jgi:hypothetical protein
MKDSCFFQCSYLSVGSPGPDDIDGAGEALKQAEERSPFGATKQGLSVRARCEMRDASHPPSLTQVARCER